MTSEACPPGHGEDASRRTRSATDSTQTYDSTADDVDPRAGPMTAEYTRGAEVPSTMDQQPSEARPAGPRVVCHLIQVPGGPPVAYLEAEIESSTCHACQASVTEDRRLTHGLHCDAAQAEIVLILQSRDEIDGPIQPRMEIKPEETAFVHAIRLLLAETHVDDVLAQPAAPRKSRHDELVEAYVAGFARAAEALRALATQEIQRANGVLAQRIDAWCQG